MLIKWEKAEVVGGFNYSSEDIDGYEIVELAEGFYVKRVFADCDDIGPLDDFKAAEDIVMKIGICLTNYEEGLWKVLAAQAIKINPITHDGTACALDEALIDAVAGPAGSH